MSEQDGGPAFPSTAFAADMPSGEVSYVPLMGGMSLRDWFAGQVLASQIDDDADADLAKRCYAIADAMLVERQKERPS